MRKRSKYKPRPVITDAMAWVKSGFAPMSTLPQAVDLKIKNHAAMQAIVSGDATRDDVDVVIAALNMTEALSRVRNELGADWKDEIRQSQDALLQMARRGVQTGRFVFKGPELTAVNLAMEIHDAQLENCRLGELEKALQLVAKEIQAKRARLICEPA